MIVYDTLLRWPRSSLTPFTRFFSRITATRSNPCSSARHWGALNQEHMDRTRTTDRSGIIRASMLLFALLAIASFALARVAW